MTNLDAAAAPAAAADDDPAARPIVTLLPAGHRRAEGGHPWIYSNEVQMDAAAKALAPGSLVTVKRADSRVLGVAMFNPHTLLAARLLDRDAARPIGRRLSWRAPAGRALRLPRTALPGAVLPARPRRGGRAARPRHRPLRSGAGRAGQRRRNGAARTGAPRGADRARSAERDRDAQRQPGARSRRLAAGGACVVLGTVDAPVAIE